LPPGAASLRAGQLGFLHKLAKKLGDVAWEPAKIQVCLFDAARITPINQADGFSALYTVLLDRQSGPKAGNLLAFLEREFVIGRLLEAPMPSVTAFWTDTAITEQELEDWVASVRSKIVAASAETFFEGIGILELTAELSDGKIHLRRCAISSFEQCNQIGYEYFVSHAINYVANLARKFEVEIPIKVNAGGEVRV
jgi:lysyl-tRNA synthetase class 1